MGVMRDVRREWPGSEQTCSRYERTLKQALYGMIGGLYYANPSIIQVLYILLLIMNICSGMWHVHSCRALRQDNRMTTLPMMWVPPQFYIISYLFITIPYMRLMAVMVSSCREGLKSQPFPKNVKRNVIIEQKNIYID